jgi:hypothetical protein
MLTVIFHQIRSDIAALIDSEIHWISDTPSLDIFWSNKTPMLPPPNCGGGYPGISNGVGALSRQIWWRRTHFNFRSKKRLHIWRPRVWSSFALDNKDFSKISDPN